MINLLPENKTKELLVGYIKNLILSFCVIIIISLACFVLLLLSVKFYILGDTTVQKNNLNTAVDEYKNQDFSDVGNTIQKYNNIFPNLVSFYENELYFNDMLDDMLKNEIPAGLNITDFSFDRKGENIEATISGTCDTRGNLTLFKDNIQSDPEIRNVYFSPDSWIKDVNPTFYLTFEFFKLKK